VKPNKAPLRQVPAKRGVQAVPPDIYVRSLSTLGEIVYRRATIRVHRDVYRYLHWRDGERWHDFYLGKVAPKYPTLPDPRAGGQLAGRRRQARAGRGVQNTGSVRPRR